MAKMRQDTPYNSRSSTEQARERECVEKILRHAEPPKKLYEAFGGIGMLGQLMSERYPLAQIDSYELDDACVAEYRSRNLKNVTVNHEDTRTKFQVQTDFDAASLDFNRFTLLDLRRPEGEFQAHILGRVFDKKPKWVHVTDSACSKIHLNWKSYGLSGPDWHEYVQALETAFMVRWGYRVGMFSKHSRAAYFLMVPQ